MTDIDLNHIPIIRRKRRTIALVIERTGEVTVRAPYRVSLQNIHDFISSKRDWIIEKVSKKLEYHQKFRCKQFVAGEEFLYLGQSYPLCLTDDPVALVFQDTFQLSVRFRERARELFIAWYKRQAKQVLLERTLAYTKKVGVHFNRLRITDARYRWGSCSSARNINFTWRLIMAPIYAVDYVVVHELCHILEGNHSHRFWAHVARVMPQYKEARDWLKDNSHVLTM